MKKVVILSIMLLTLLSGRVKPVEAGTYKVNPMTVDLMNSHNLYVHLDDLRLFNGELVNEKEFAQTLTMALLAIEEGKIPEKRAKEIVNLAIRYTDIRLYHQEEFKNMRYRLKKVAKY